MLDIKIESIRSIGGTGSIVVEGKDRDIFIYRITRDMLDCNGIEVTEDNIYKTIPYMERILASDTNMCDRIAVDLRRVYMKEYSSWKEEFFMGRLFRDSLISIKSLEGKKPDDLMSREIKFYNNQIRYALRDKKILTQSELIKHINAYGIDSFEELSQRCKQIIIETLLDIEANKLGINNKLNITHKKQKLSIGWKLEFDGNDKNKVISNIAKDMLYTFSIYTEDVTNEDIIKFATYIERFLAAPKIKEKECELLEELLIFYKYDGPINLFEDYKKEMLTGLYDRVLRLDHCDGEEDLFIEELQIKEPFIIRILFKKDITTLKELRVAFKNNFFDNIEGIGDKKKLLIEKTLKPLL